MLKSLSAKLGQALVLFGAWGLFGISFLDSSFIPFPVVNDLALIVMASKRPAWWPLFGLQTTLGSICGAYLLYGLARGGRRIFRRKPTVQARTRAQHWLQRNDFVAILVASLLPPPAPLKVFVLTAGLLRVNALRFGLALLVGRGLRFTAEAWLGARYGPQAQDYLRRNLAWTSVASVVMVIGMAVFYRWWKRRVDGNPPQAS
jgi:membrane protein YqaA with SNARE-associated domain